LNLRILSSATSIRNSFQKKLKQAGCWWLVPVILATQEAEIRRITVRSQRVPRDHITKIGLVRVAQGIGPEFKTQYHKKKINLSKVLLAHTCNPIKITRVKWTGVWLK
jgi:hypothetical protein